MQQTKNDVIKLVAVKLNDMTPAQLIDYLKKTPVLRLGWGNPEKTVLHAWGQTITVAQTQNQPVFIGGPGSYVELREADFALLKNGIVAIAGGMSTQIVGTYTQDDRTDIAQFLGNLIVGAMQGLNQISLKVTFDGSAKGNVEYGFYALPSIDSTEYEYLSANACFGLDTAKGNQILNVKSVENLDLGAEDRPFVVAYIAGGEINISTMQRTSGETKYYIIPNIEGVQLIDQAAVAISENAIVFVGIDMDGETIVFSANIADNQMKVNVLDGLTVISARYAPTTAETLFLITENKQILTGVIDASTGQVKNLNLATGINTDVLNRNVRGFIPGDNGNLLLHTTDIVEIGDREAPTFSLIEIPATNFAAA